MQALAWLGFAFGVVLLLLTGSSVIKTLLIPRNLSSAIGAAVARTVLLPYRRMTAGIGDLHRREKILATGAWPHFRGWRVNYEAAAHGIAAHLDLPPALWSGPRTRLGKTTAPPRRPAHREPGTPDDPAGSPRDAETPLRVPGQ
jgi:hypothetical protein